MAITKSNLDQKGIRHRGVYGGKEQSVTGVIRLNEGASLATTDILHMIPLGENVRPLRIALHAAPLRGNPVLTGGAMNVGVIPYDNVPFKRPDGTEYPAIPTAPAAFGAITLPTGQPLQDTIAEAPRPVATSVPLYAPYRVTLTPSAAFSVAGGDIELSLTLVYVGEQFPDGYIYSEFLSQKVGNDERFDD